MNEMVVLITGGTGGFGAVFAKRFRQAGARVYCADLPGSASENVLDFIASDVTRVEDLQPVIAQILAQSGRLDVCIANAGWVPEWYSTSELDVAEWDKVQAINVRGVAFTLAASAQALKASRGGPRFGATRRACKCYRPRTGCHASFARSRRGAKSWPRSCAVTSFAG